MQPMVASVALVAMAEQSRVNTAAAAAVVAAALAVVAAAAALAAECLS